MDFPALQTLAGRRLTLHLSRRGELQTQAEPGKKASKRKYHLHS